MSILKVAESIVQRYKLGNNADKLEKSIRDQISILWEYPNKTYNILSVCADASPRKASTPQEAKAVEGAKFCRQLISIISYLKTQQYEMNLTQLRNVLTILANLINEHKNAKFSESGKISEEGVEDATQYAHVSSLIYEIMPYNTRSARRDRDQQYSKAKTGLSRILSVTLTMLENLSKLELIAPEKFEESEENEDMDVVLPERFTPERTMLSDYDIIDFIRQRGEEYGISDTEDWATVFRDDPELKRRMTTIINAINRGHYPRGSADMKMEIARILKEHEERKATNLKEFEDESALI